MLTALFQLPDQRTDATPWVLMALLLVSGLAVLFALMRAGIGCSGSPSKAMCRLSAFWSCCPSSACWRSASRSRSTLNPRRASCRLRRTIFTRRRPMQRGSIRAARRTTAGGQPMTALVPHPFLSAFLLGLWLLLNQSLSPGHVLLGSVIAVAGGLCDFDARDAESPPSEALCDRPARVRCSIGYRAVQHRRCAYHPCIRPHRRSPAS